jgi:chemotaxis protein CheX
MTLPVEQLQIFIDASRDYFSVSTGVEAEVGTPYLIESDRPLVNEYTGIIGISGVRKGCVYLTASRVMLKGVLVKMGLKKLDREQISDLVGEIANTIAGAARREFGGQFHISVPIVVCGDTESVHLPKSIKCYAIPIVWKSYSASLVIGLS